jgi:ribose transport system substrate-binding protein
MPFRFQILALILCSTFLSAQNREILGEYKLGIIGRDKEDVIYQAAHEGAKSAALELSRKYSLDVELLVFTPDKTQGEAQITSLSELFIEDADGLIISPQDNESVRASVKFALNQGQEVVYFERQLTGIDPLTAMLADEIEAGRMAGREIIKRLPTKGRIAILTSTEPGPELAQRLGGLREVLGFRRIQTIVNCEPNYRSAIEAINKSMEEDRNDQIKGWVFLEDWPLLGMPALPWDPKRMPVVAIQSSPSAFMYVDQGYLDALIVHPYYQWGYSSVEAMIEKLHNGKTPEQAIILTDPRVVDWTNVKEYREEWLKWLK